MVAIKLEGVSNLLPSGEYIVALEKSELRDTRDKTKQMVNFQCTIVEVESLNDPDYKGEENDLIGKKCFRNFVLTDAALVFFKEALAAFEAPEEWLEGALDTDDLPELYGSKAKAIITKEPDRQNSAIIRNVVVFKPIGF